MSNGRTPVEQMQEEWAARILPKVKNYQIDGVPMTLNEVLEYVVDKLSAIELRLQPTDGIAPIDTGEAYEYQCPHCGKVNEILPVIPKFWRQLLKKNEK